MSKMNPYDLPSGVLSFIPHRDAMLLIDRLEKVETDIGIASMSIKKENIFYHDKRGLNPVAFIELIAQTAAAHNGYTELTHQRPIRSGFLTGVKNFRISGVASVGERLTIHIHRVFEMKNAHVVEGSVVSENNMPIASGTLNLWLFDEDMPSIPDTGKEPPMLTNPSHIPAISAQDRDAVEAYMMHHLQVQEIGEKKINGSICFTSDFIGFKGHFPNTPILPGIVSLNIAIISTEILLEKRLCLHQVDKTKFKQPALPNQRLNIECSIQEDKNGQYARMELTADNGKIASVMIRFKDEE